MLLWHQGGNLAQRTEFALPGQHEERTQLWLLNQAHIAHVFWAPSRVPLLPCQAAEHTTAPLADAIYKQHAFSPPAGIGLNASAATLEAAAAVKLPDDDGLWLLDTETGSTSLLVSLQQIHSALHQGPLSGRKDSSTGQPYNNTGVAGRPSVTGHKSVTEQVKWCRAWWPAACHWAAGDLHSRLRLQALCGCRLGTDQRCFRWPAQCQSRMMAGLPCLIMCVVGHSGG